MKKGFTLLELIVVIIIIGILATLGVTQYTKVIEKGRTAEAKMILGQIRTAQEARKLEYGSYTTDTTNLAVGDANFPWDTCKTTHYFKYTVGSTTATATRCTTGERGKTPDFSGTAYAIILDYATGEFSSPSGY